MRRFINLVMALLAIPMILLSCDAVQSVVGIDSSGGDNSSGSSQFDRIIDKHMGLSVTFSFNGAGLGLPDSPSYEWDFGDEQTSTKVAPTHTYVQAGAYTVTVRVTGTKTDGSSFDQTFTRAITVKEADIEASNSYLYAEKNKENHLQYSFYTPMVFAGVPSENVTYEWYADNKSAVTAETHSNVFGYIYDKYGKTYTAQVTAKSGTGLESYATVNITTPSPEVNLICTTQGLTVTCYPEITLDGEKVDDIPMDFEWDCGDGTYRKTSGTEPNTCIYDESNGNEQTITVEGSSDKLEKPVTDEKTVYISSILSVGQVECIMAGMSDHLTWDCNIITTVSEEGKNGTLEYRWHFGEDNADWTSWELINPGNNSKTHTYAKYRNSNSPDYNVQVEVRYKANNGTETVQTSETADTTEYFEQGSSSDKITIIAPTVRIEQQAGADNKFERTFTAFFNNDYIPKGALKYTWNFGDGNTKQTDTSIATHTYNSNGAYKVTVSVESAESEKVFPNGYIEAAELDFTIDENINITDTTNAIKKTQDPNNPLIWDFRLEGVTSSTGNLVYTWKKDGQVIGTNSTELNDVTFDKFGKSYTVTVEISIEGTDITKTVSTDVTIDIPTVKINVPSPIMTGKDAVFTNTITYGSVDVKNLLTSPVVYSWVVDNDPLKTDSVTKNWQNPGEGKAATLTVTAGNVERPMIAQQKTFNVLQSQLFGDVRIECNNNARLSEYDTIRWTCTGTALDNKNQEMEVEPNAYRYEWYAEPTVTDTVDTVKTTLNKEEATIILDWPTDEKAKNTPSRTYKICAKVFDKNNAAIATKCQGNITVQRKVSYTAKVQGSDGTGENVQNIIQVTALKGPANATYKWVHKIDTYYSNNNLSQSDTNIPISGLSTTGNISLTNQVNNIGFIGKIIGNPFKGANGIGLEVSGNGLSRPVKIYGLQNDNQILGPSFRWCSNSYHIIHSRAYEETANTQNPNMPWGDINKNGRYEHGEGNLIYIWGITGVNTVADMSREQGVFAKITVLSQNAKSLRRDGLLWVGGNIATINDTLEINKRGNSSAPANALVFYLDRNNAAKNGGTFKVLLKVKDTSRNGGQQFIDYGTCSSTYSTSIEW